MTFLSPGTTQVSLVGTLVDNSTNNTSGQVVTGKNSSNFTTPLVVIFSPVSGGMTAGTITPGLLASYTSNFSAGGLVEIASGRYRLDQTASGAAQVLNIAGEGTVGSFIVESVLWTNTASNYMGVNVVNVNGSSAAAANLALFPPITTTASMFGVTVVVDNGTSTRNAYALGFNGTANFSSLVVQAGTLTLNGTNTFNITGNLTGTVGAVAGSVNGNIGGNLVGGVGGTVNATTTSITATGNTSLIIGAVAGSVNGNIGGSVVGGVGGTTNAATPAQVLTQVNSQTSGTVTAGNITISAGTSGGGTLTVNSTSLVLPPNMGILSINGSGYVTTTGGAGTTTNVTMQGDDVRME